MRNVSWERLRLELLSLYEPPLRAAATYRQMRQALAEFAALPGVSRSADLTPANVAKWIRAYPDRSPARTGSMLRILSVVATYATASGYLARDPFDFRSPGQWVRLDAAPPKPRVQRHRTAAQIGRLLDLADAEAASGGWTDGRRQALLYTYAFTGVRAKEALTLERADIDLDARSLWIRPKADWRPKTARSSARLPIAPPLADVLARWLPRTGCAWAFPGTKLRGPWTGGGPGYKANDEIKAAGERAGIGAVTPLCFRKSLGTLAKSWGLTQLEVKALMRHTNLKTQEWYDEDDPEVLLVAASKIVFPRILNSA